MIQFLPGSRYLIRNASVGSDLLFKRPEDYNAFIFKSQRYIDPIADSLSWSYIPDQFSLIIEVKSIEAIIKEYEKIKLCKCPKDLDLNDFVLQRIENFLISYAKTYNNFYHRKGSVFIHHLYREELTTYEELITKMVGIHQSPQTNKHIENFEEWHYSSFRNFLEKSTRNLQQEYILESIGGIDKFKKLHK